MNTPQTCMIFDFDGTIADSFKLAHAIFNQLSTRHSYEPVPDDQVDIMRQKTAKDFFATLGISLLKVPILAMQARKALRAQIATVPPCPGIIEVLPKLVEKGIRCGIVTSNSTDNVSAFLEANKLTSFFEFTYCSLDLFSKAKRIKSVIRKKKLSRYRVIYIGDTDTDVVAAQQANIDMAAVTWGYQAREVLQQKKPTWLLDSPDQLLDLV